VLTELRQQHRSPFCQVFHRLTLAEACLVGLAVPDTLNRPTTRRAPPPVPQAHGRDWYFIAEQPVPALHLAHLEGCAALRIVLVTVPRVCRSCDHFPDGFDLHLVPMHSKQRGFRLQPPESSSRHLHGCCCSCCCISCKYISVSAESG